tara:strand:+ start:69760 stop:70380 length:621 start_codon:yes stop_codon:yes gene_type:complete
MLRYTLITIYSTFLFISCKQNKSNIEYDIKGKSVYFFENKEIVSDSARVLFNNGIEEQQNKNFDNATKLIEKANEVENNNPIIINGLANLEFLKGNKSYSYELLESALKIDSTNVPSYVNMAANYMKDRKYLEASKMLEKGLDYVSQTNNHQKSILHLNLAIAYNNMDDCKNGLLSANQALKFSENSELRKFAKKIIKESKVLCSD